MALVCTQPNSYSGYKQVFLEMLNISSKMFTHKSQRNSERTVPMAPLMRINIHCWFLGHSNTSSLVPFKIRNPGHRSNMQNIPTKPGREGEQNIGLELVNEDLQTKTFPRRNQSNKKRKLRKKVGMIYAR